MSEMAALTEDQRRALRKAASQDEVTFKIKRDDLLIFIGWTEAHRRQGDWESLCVSTFLVRARMAVAGALYEDE